MIQDKEQLFDQAIKLKQNMDNCLEENIRLKNRIQQFDKELDKRDKIIQELLFKVDSDQGISQMNFQPRMAEPHLVSALKNQIKNMKNELRLKEEETTKMKKNIKITRIQEAEIEMRMFSDECTRLKHLIEEIVKQKAIGYTMQDINALGEKINKQTSLLNNIQQENKQMSSILQKKEEELSNWKEVTTKLEKKISSLSVEAKENMKVRKSYNDSKKELQNIKDKLTQVKLEGKDKQIGAFRAKIDELLRKQKEMTEKIDIKERKIKNLEEVSAQKKNNFENELGELKKKAGECTLYQLHNLYRRKGNKRSTC